MRPRERYDHEGPARFGDTELLALAIGTGTASYTTRVIAAGLLDRFGSLDDMALADPRELAEVPGLGRASAVRLHAALEVGRRSMRSPPQSDAPVLTPAQAAAHLQPGLSGLADEQLHALYLDRRRRPMGLRHLTTGSDRYTVVDPRQIFRPALRVGAHAVVLAHNHPSGDPEPSTQDEEVTRRCATAGRVLGIAVLDHIVVGGTSWTSLAERGRLPAWTPPPAVWTS